MKPSKFKLRTSPRLWPPGFSCVPSLGEHATCEAKPVGSSSSLVHLRNAHQNKNQEGNTEREHEPQRRTSHCQSSTRQQPAQCWQRGPSSFPHTREAKPRRREVPNLRKVKGRRREVGIAQLRSQRASLKREGTQGSRIWTGSV